MDIENQEVKCSADDEYRVYCAVWDKLCIERYYINHPKSRTHINNFNQRQRVIKTII